MESNKLCVRVSMMMNFTEDELKTIVECNKKERETGSQNPFKESFEILQKIISEGRYELDEETYIPNINGQVEGVDPYEFDELYLC